MRAKSQRTSGFELDDSLRVVRYVGSTKQKDAVWRALDYRGGEKVSAPLEVNRTMSFASELRCGLFEIVLDCDCGHSQQS
jgi:hypothetical protein